MRVTHRILILCLALLLPLTATGCRGRFHPAEPPTEGWLKKTYPEDFECWVITAEDEPYAASDPVELFKTVKRIYERSDYTDSFPDGEGMIRLIFCMGGSAPEMVIPSYQLPNATHYGVYTLYPDDTGRYSGVLLTANVTSFSLKEGSYAAIANMLSEE